MDVNGSMERLLQRRAYGKQSPFFCVIIDTARAFSLSLFDLSMAALQRPTGSILTSECRLE